MSNSTHRVEIVPVTLTPHPNADSLSIVPIFDHYQVVVRTENWLDCSIGAYVPPDSLLPDKPEYSFLKGNHVKCAKLMGCVSHGLLLPAPPNSQIGDDVAAILGVTHYVPPLAEMPRDAEPPPPMPGFMYDIDSWYRYGKEFLEGMPVWISEKIHGANARYTFQNDRMYVGSRSWFLKKQEKSYYWLQLEPHKYPGIENYCRRYPNHIVYGEVFGNVAKGGKYGFTSKDTPSFRAFDIWTGTRFLDYLELVQTCRTHMIPMVPVLWDGLYSQETILQYISGASRIDAQHKREGIVIKPQKELFSPKIGRMVLKAVCPEF